VRELFDIIGLINTKAEYPSEEELKVYSSFMGNRAMSQHQELIFFAEEMNERWGMPKEANFAFYYYGVPKRKRFGKWAKPGKELDDKIAILKEYYGLPTIKCKEIIPLVDELDLWDKMAKELSKGGARLPKKSSSKKDK